MAYLNPSFELLCLLPDLTPPISSVLGVDPPGPTRLYTPASSDGRFHANNSTVLPSFPSPSRDLPEHRINVFLVTLKAAAVFEDFERLYTVTENKQLPQYLSIVRDKVFHLRDLLYYRPALVVTPRFEPDFLERLPQSQTDSKGDQPMAEDQHRSRSGVPYAQSTDYLASDHNDHDPASSKEEELA